MRALISILLVLAELIFGIFLTGALIYLSFYGYYTAACHYESGAGLALIVMIAAPIVNPFVGALYALAVVSIVIDCPFRSPSKF